MLCISDSMLCPAMYAYFILFLVLKGIMPKDNKEFELVIS